MVCVAEGEAVWHAGWKAQAWAMRLAVPTGMELYGLAVAAAVPEVARKRSDKEEKHLIKFVATGIFFRVTYGGRKVLKE